MHFIYVIAQASMDAPQFQLTTEKSIATLVLSAAFSLVFWYVKGLSKRVGRLESALGRHMQFTAGVAAASMQGPTVPSSLIHDLHDQYQPPDDSGIHRTIPRHRT